jgi:predicted ATPase with chaperone activity
LWGPPGNGKTTIAKGLGRYLNRFANEIYVPYAILVDNCIVTVFDPGIHQTTDDTDLAQRGITAPANGVLSGPVQDGPIDLRWRRVRRPVVVTGNELTLDLLELKYHKPGNFYHAPLQIKANGGLFLIDDLGRQTVRSQELINRWTILEESFDYLTLANGRKCMLPIEQLTVFATNLDPQQVVDEAFMRRIKHKIHIEAPVHEQYAAIFQLACRQQEVPYDEAMVEDLLQKYRDLGRTPRSSDPRDLLNMARSICRFHELPFTLNTNLMQDSASRFFDAA